VMSAQAGIHDFFLTGDPPTSNPSPKPQQQTPAIKTSPSVTPAMPGNHPPDPTRIIPPTHNPKSILERIVFAVPGHRHGERTQRVQHARGCAMVRQHVG